MVKSGDLIKKADIDAIVDRGTKIYERIKKKYEPKHIGKFLAIDPKSGDVYLGKDTVRAVQKGRKEHPKTVFFLVKIGYSAAEILARLRHGESLQELI